jgi:hypothetical protein
MPNRGVTFYDFSLFYIQMLLLFEIGSIQALVGPNTAECLANLYSDVMNTRLLSYCCYHIINFPLLSIKP